MYRVKEWNKYQSYKDRRPPWIRLHKALLDNFEYQRMSAEARALLPMLWLLASEDIDPISGRIQQTEQEIAFRLRMDEKTLSAAIHECIENGFLEVMENKGCNGSVTDSLQNGRDFVTPETETEVDTKTEKHIVQPDGRTPFAQKEKFEEAWKLYPKREGKKQAFRHYCASVKSEDDHARLLTSLGNYKRLVEAENAQRRGDPRPWKHGGTWFNNWQDYEEVDMPIRKHPSGLNPRPKFEDTRPAEEIAADLLDTVQGLRDNDAFNEAFADLIDGLEMPQHFIVAVRVIYSKLEEHQNRFGQHPLPDDSREWFESICGDLGVSGG